MCGLAGAMRRDGAIAPDPAAALGAALAHRGPDGHGIWTDAGEGVALGHTRLSIIDLSSAGNQPMVSADGRFVLGFNGEIYNHVELRSALGDYPFRSRTDTEVVLAAWARWGTACLDRLLGMFAFAIWDTRDHRLVAVRDRFGVKPLYLARLAGGGLALASEIKALHAGGLPAEPDPIAWATYLANGISDQETRTFWRGIEPLAAGCMLTWQSGKPPTVRRWYDVAERIGVELDDRDEATVGAEYLALLRDSVRLRFRADVPVGINLSGGLDSSLLLGLVQAVQGADSDLKVFSFVTGDERYDELPWVKLMLEHTRHPLIVCALAAEDVPALTDELTRAADEPFGGIPTLAYATVFRRAREHGVVVLLDGQGMDEQWAGYDYYRAPNPAAAAPLVQGSVDPAVRPDCLATEFAAVAEVPVCRTPFPDRLRNLQYRDLTSTKIPRALRYNDRVSMAASTELREPFLDHRLIELALRQPPERKLGPDSGKRMLRDLAAPLLPATLRLAPKRPVQTPQREWLRGPLQRWARERIEAAVEIHPDWFDAAAATRAWNDYVAGQGDNSHWVWQWISAGMVSA